MAYKLCPDEGFPRLWRFVSQGQLPDDVLCTLDPVQNLLVINQPLFDKLPAFPDRHIVLRTHHLQIKAIHRPGAVFAEILPQ